MMWYALIVLVCWPLCAYAILQVTGDRDKDAGIYLCSVAIGYLAALIWPLTLTGAAIGYGLYWLKTRQEKDVP